MSSAGVSPEHHRRIAVSFGTLSVAKVFGDLFTFALFVLISRLFGKEGIGVYSFAIALTGIFAVLSEMGMNMFTIRELPTRTEPFETLFGRMVSFRITLVAVAYALLLAILPLLPFPRDTLVVIALVGVYQIAYQTVMGLAVVFLAEGTPLLTGAVEASFKTFTAVGAIAVAVLGWGFTATMAALPAVAVPIVIAAYVLVARRYGRPRLVARLSTLLTTGRHILPYGLYVLFLQIQQRLDVTLLALLVGATAAGVYNVAYRVVFIFFFIAHFLGLSVLPVASELYAESSRRLVWLYRKSLNLSILIGLPSAVGLFLVAPDVISLVFGDAFAESVPLLRILSILFFLVFPRFVVGSHLTACGRQDLRTRCQLFALLTAFVLYPPLIVWRGMTGAAIAAVVTEAVLVGFLVWKLHPLLGYPAVGGRMAIAGIATAAFAVPVLLMPAQPLLLVIPGSALIYVAVLLLFSQIRGEELELLRDLVRRQGARDLEPAVKEFVH